MPRRQRLVATLRWSGVPVVASRGGKFANASAERNTVSSKASVFGLLDEAPMTGLHYYYWLLASGGTLLDGFSVVSLGIAIPLLKQDMTITPVFVGLIGSALVLGAVLGAMLGGIAADRIGRKHVFIADMAIMVVGSVLCTMAHETPKPRRCFLVSPGRRCL
jgi:hypothetical protein